MRLAHIALTSVAALVLLSYQSQAQAQVLESVAAASLAGMTVGAIFNRVDDTVTKAINQAQNAGNGLIMHAANQTEMLEQDARLVVTGPMNQSFDNLNEDERNLLIEMEQWRQAASDFTESAYNLVDTVNLDTAYNLSHLPFTKVPDFFVQSVNGVAFLQQAGDYIVTLKALHLGIEAGHRADISVDLDHHPLEINTPDQTRLNQAVIDIPNAALAPYFQANHLRTVSLVINVIMNRFGLFHIDHVQSYQVPVTLTLYPALAGTGDITVTYPHYDWVPIGPVVGNASGFTPDRNGCTDPNSGCAFSGVVAMKVPSSQTNPPSPGDEKITFATLDCPGHQPWCPDSRVLNGTPTDNGSTETIWFQRWSRPVQLRVVGTASQYQRRATDDSEKIPVSLYFDRMTRISIPGNFTSLSLHISTFTGGTEDLDLVNQTDKSKLVNVVSLGTQNSPTRSIELTASVPAIAH